MNFRSHVFKNAFNPQQEDVDKIEVVTIEFALNLLDLIENRISNIEKSLSWIKGLSEIDSIKEDVEQLSKDLY